MKKLGTKKVGTLIFIAKESKTSNPIYRQAAELLLGRQNPKSLDVKIATQAMKKHQRKTEEWNDRREAEELKDQLRKEVEEAKRRRAERRG